MILTFVFLILFILIKFLPIIFELSLIIRIYDTICNSIRGVSIVFFYRFANSLYP